MVIYSDTVVVLFLIIILYYQYKIKLQTTLSAQSSMLSL